ncbi:MAG TPA: hypothetical protein VJA21_10515 [Verrucomicrobiae bacterium]
MLHGNPMMVSQIARLVEEAPSRVADDLAHLSLFTVSGRFTEIPNAFGTALIRKPLRLEIDSG